MLPDTGSMFFGFFEFYGKYWDWKSGVISVRQGRLATFDNPDEYLKKSPVERTHCLFIEDPFDIKKDVCNAASIDHARNEIIEAAELLSMGNSPGSLMAAKSNSRRQQRADSAI
jgi:DNA polymerase sigma